MHFYPGCAEYEEPNQPPYRVLLKEPALRLMDPTFAGCPVFVQHVDEIETDINELRKEADGWVVESFFNQADGKHWTKFVVCSDRAEQAIKKGMRLSNCYLPTELGPPGTWNGISYEKEILSADYEHLAIVPNPRYEESVILSPDQFKKYNEQKLSELVKIANHKKGEEKMKFNFFERKKVENSLDMENMTVVLPKSQKERVLSKLINEADDAEMKKDEPKMAHPNHMVEMNGEKMSVGDLVKKHAEACNALEEMKKEKPEAKSNDEDDADGDDDGMENDGSQDMETAGKEVPMPEDDKEGERKSLELEEEEEKEVKDAKRMNALEKSERLKNAHKTAHLREVTISLSDDQVSRGKSLYGSN